MRIIEVRGLSKLNIDEYVEDLCSGVGKNYVVMIMYWDNSIMYVGGDKCSDVLENVLSDLEKECALARIILLKPSNTVSVPPPTYTITKIVEVDFSSRDNIVREYYVDEPTMYYLDERVKVIS